MISQQSQHFFAQATKLFYQMEFEKGIQQINKSISSCPNSSMLYSNRALFYSQFGKVDQAIEDLKLSIELNYLNYVAYFNLFSLQLRQGEDKQAFDNLCCSLSCLYLMRGKLKKKQLDLQKSIRYCQNNLQAHILKGLMLMQKGNLKLALNEFQWAEDIDSENMTAKKIKQHILKQLYPSEFFQDKFQSIKSSKNYKRLECSYCPSQLENSFEEQIKQRLNQFNDLYNELNMQNGTLTQRVPITGVQNQNSIISEYHDNTVNLSQIYELRKQKKKPSINQTRNNSDDHQNSANQISNHLNLHRDQQEIQQYQIIPQDNQKNKISENYTKNDYLIDQNDFNLIENMEVNGEQFQINANKNDDQDEDEFQQKLIIQEDLIGYQYERVHQDVQNNSFYRNQDYLTLNQREDYYDQQNENDQKQEQKFLQQVGKTLFQIQQDHKSQVFSILNSQNKIKQQVQQKQEILLNVAQDLVQQKIYNFQTIQLGEKLQAKQQKIQIQNQDDTHIKIKYIEEGYQNCTKSQQQQSYGKILTSSNPNLKFHQSEVVDQRGIYQNQVTLIDDLKSNHSSQNSNKSGGQYFHAESQERNKQKFNKLQKGTYEEPRQTHQQIKQEINKNEEPQIVKYFVQKKPLYPISRKLIQFQYAHFEIVRKGRVKELNELYLVSVYHLSIPKYKMKTSSKKPDGKICRWDQKFPEMNILQNIQSLKLKIFNKGKGTVARDQLLGQGQIQVSSTGQIRVPLYQQKVLIGHLNIIISSL